VPFRSSRPRLLLAVLAGLLGLLLAGCASFPAEGPRDWQAKTEGQGELGGPPSVQDPSDPGEEGGQPPTTTPGQPGAPNGCDDPDPRVVATCLDPVSAVAPLPGTDAALVAERATGRILRVQRGTQPEVVTTIPVDAAGGGLIGMVLSPGYQEDRLVYAYISTPEGNQVVRVPPGEPAKPIFTGIPRGAPGVGGLGVDADGSLLVATGAQGGDPADPRSLAGKVLRIDTLGRPSVHNPDPASPVLSSGLRSPAGVCADPISATTWVTDRTGLRDVLYRITTGPVGTPAWSWPDRPGVAGCVAQPGAIGVAMTTGGVLALLKPGDDGRFTAPPENLLANTYGRLAAAGLGSDGLVWLGTANKAGGKPVASDDRVIRLPLLSGGGADRA
jgi:glucose/arabinose dehydrogenase